MLIHSLPRLLYVLNPTGTLVPNGGQFHKRWIASTGVILIKAPLLSLLRSRRSTAQPRKPANHKAATS